jgi:putative hydrolase of the HAD superfamily
MNLVDVDALSFDCYGTLIDWETGIGNFLDSLHDAYPQLPEREAFLETYGERESATERDFPAMPYPDVLARSFGEAAAAHGVSLPDDVTKAFGASVPDWPAFPDSAEALARLAQRYRLIILSNVDRASFRASNARLGVTFDAILTAEDIGSYKPDPRNFDALLERIDELGIDRSRLLHVAQSLFHDHVPAKAIGLRTVWIDRRQGRSGSGATPEATLLSQPDVVYHSMVEFADAVEAGDG